MTRSLDDLPPWIKTGTVVRLIGECLSTVHQRIKTGHRVARRTPTGRWLVQRESLLAYLGGTQ